MISGRTDDDMTDDPAAQDRDAEPEDRGANDLEADIAAFWSEARTRARFDWIGAYGGPTILGSLRPPAWSFGATPEEADAVLTRVLDEKEITRVAQTLAQEAGIPAVTEQQIQDAIAGVTEQTPTTEETNQVAARLASAGWPLAVSLSDR